MRIQRFVLPAFALVGAAAVVTPGTAEGYDLLGFSLNTTRRDFRVLNNFTDPQANNNQTPDPNFPGAQGAEMAIWKAATEWASRPHGDGNGDPNQPGSLGSGLANFDFTYQGHSNSPGQTGDEVVYELGGCNGGVLAVTQYFTNGSGWTMWFYSCYTWYDGPGTNFASGGGRFDIQGVATHEFGHALGLGHSGVGNATMLAGTPDGKAARTIEADDRAGIQAIYGAAAANKPEIQSISWNGSSLTLLGRNFSTTNNRVWFTPIGVGTGQPVQLSNVASSQGGTEITVTPPANAGPGDVLVKANFGGNASLSNAYPFDPAVVNCPAPTRYCTPVASPIGVPARIDVVGSTSVQQNDFTLLCNSAPPGTFGLFYYGPFRASIPGGDGIICIGSPFFRLPPVQANFVGQALYTYDLTQPPTALAQIAPGSVWNFSFWFRQQSPSGYNFSDAIEVIFCP